MHHLCRCRRSNHIRGRGLDVLVVQSQRLKEGVGVIRREEDAVGLGYRLRGLVVEAQLSKERGLSV